MPSLSTIAIVMALAVSVASLIVLLLSSQNAKKKHLELHQRVTRLEEQLAANFEEIKRDISFLKSERHTTGGDTLQYLKAKKAESAGSAASSKQNGELSQSNSGLEQVPETERDTGPEAPQSGDDGPSEPSASDDSSSRIGTYDGDSSESEPGRLGQYSLDLVQRLYRDWCAALSKPEIPASVEARLAEYAFLEPAPPQGGAATHVIRDTSRIGEFIRFSAVGADVGVVLPNPTAHFTPVVAHLFPGLTRDAYEGSVSRLTALGPVSVKRRTPTEWEAI